MSGLNSTPPLPPSPSLPPSLPPFLPVPPLQSEKLLIKGGRVVNDDQSVFADVYIEDGLIKCVYKALIMPKHCRGIAVQILVP